MFQESSDKVIDQNLQALAKDIENQSPALSVLAARNFRYKIQQNFMEVNVSKPRPYNILEELLLQAAMELEPPPTVVELASVLGLDPIFVSNTTANLQKLDILEYNSEDIITLTPKGKEFYHQGTLPQSTETEAVYLVNDPLRQDLYCQVHKLLPFDDELPNLTEIVSLNYVDSYPLSLEKVQSLLQNPALNIHKPPEGKTVTDYYIATPGQQIWQKISVFLIHDLIEDEIKLQARRGDSIFSEASEMLNQALNQDKILLENLWGLSDEEIRKQAQQIKEKRNEEAEKRVAIIKDQVRKNIQKPTSETGLAIVRDRQIRQTFINSLESATESVFIYSPWVNDSVIDKKFIDLLTKLVNRGVWVLIGHGISRVETEEDKPIPPEVEAKLKAIKTPEGLSGVQVFWLGNSHTKEVVVDQKIHLCGSHNWLSYRGDRFPRGETVYRVTLPESVQEAYEFWRDRFNTHAHKLWQQGLSTKDITKAESSLCIWGALGMEEYALKQLPQDTWTESKLLWYGIIQQGLRAKRISPDADFLSL